MARLVYVSNNILLPDGRQNPFFLQEKDWLLERFGSIHVVCPKGIYLCREKDVLKLKKPVAITDKICAFFEGLFDAEVYAELRRMKAEKALSLRNVYKLFRFAMDGAKMSRMIRKSLAASGTEDTILYSYWMSYDAYAVAKVKQKNTEIYAISRAHSYEIQLERNRCNPYLMKNYICRNMDKVAFISQDSLSRFQRYYKGDSGNLCVQYLGSSNEGTGIVVRPKNEQLTVLTCSAIVPVKQLEWMIHALENWEICPLRWIHIGDGIDGTKIRTLASERLDSNKLVSYEFCGYMENSRVHKRLAQNDIDVFVNVSKAEGVPVSIMEAMSVGLPVIAPRIFGIPELVQDGCGLLFEQDQGVEAFTKALTAFAQLGSEERVRMGRCAYDRWENAFCLIRNLNRLFGAVGVED